MPPHSHCARRAAACAALAWAAACGSRGDATPTAPAAVPVASIMLTPDSGTVGIGDTLQLSATAVDASGQVIPGATITFTSSDQSLATVSAGGTVAGQLLGSVTITASAGQKTATAQIQVTPEPAASLGSGDGFSCALTFLGKAYCWGVDSVGQLGNGASAGSNVAVAVSGNLTFIQLSVGTKMACGVTIQHAGYCWGAGAHGQLGNGSTVASAVPVQVASATPFQALAAGLDFACGLTTTGVAFCWGGNNTDGAYSDYLGTGDTLSSSVPRAVAGNFTFRSISAGLSHACGITTSGTLMCWGNNVFFQLGTGDSLRALSPVQPQGGIAFVSANAGALMTCGTTTTGDAYCWGSDGYGSLGAGVETRPVTYHKATPNHIAAPVPFKSVRPAIANDIFGPTCALSATGVGYCWGSNDSDELTGGGSGSCTFASVTFPCAGAPVLLQTTATFTAIAPGGQHVCGITTSHTLLCWGSNVAGELGDGTNTTNATPVAVAGGLRTP